MLLFFVLFAIAWCPFNQYISSSSSSATTAAAASERASKTKQNKTNSHKEKNAKFINIIAIYKHTHTLIQCVCAFYEASLKKNYSQCHLKITFSLKTFVQNQILIFNLPMWNNNNSSKAFIYINVHMKIVNSIKHHDHIYTPKLKS